MSGPQRLGIFFLALFLIEGCIYPPVLGKETQYEIVV